MRKLIYAVVGILLIAGTLATLWSIGNSTTFQFFGEIVPRVEASEKLVSLTFDDGPTAGYTEEILQILEEEDVKATFFLIGSDLEKYPAGGRLIAAAGHEIGNHSFTHNRMLLSSPGEVASEVERTDEQIRATGFTGQVHFRPPYGKKLFTLPWYLSQRGRKTVTWDVAPESIASVNNNTEAIVHYTLDNTKPGSIILLHVMYDKERRSQAAVRPIIRGLKERGYRFVTVSGLLENRGRN